MGMGSGGIVIQQMQAQMKAAGGGGQDNWSGLVFFLGLYCLFATLLGPAAGPWAGAIVLGAGVAAQVREQHQIPLASALADDSFEIAPPRWQGWALFSALVVTSVQILSSRLFTALLADHLGWGAPGAAAVLALVPAAATFYLLGRLFGPERLSSIGHFARAQAQRLLSGLGAMRA